MALYTVKALDSVDWKERPIKFIFASDEENLHMRSDAKGDLRRRGGRCARGVQLRDRLHGQIAFCCRSAKAAPGQHQDSRQSIPLGHCTGEGPLGSARGGHKIVEIESQNDIMRGRLMNCGMVDGGIGENTIPDSCEVRIGIRFPNAEVRDEISKSRIVRPITTRCRIRRQNSI